ncbi:MAG: alpha/beta hydrolase, partial [Methylococcaceae bacterium]|nr:alpha/beta hydrolase [Methylococcaceae bacterium]
MTLSCGRFASADGLSLHYCVRLGGGGRPALVFVHGVGEHIGRYPAAFDWFAGRGYDCFGFDQRGFGRSEGRRGHVSDFSHYVADLAGFIDQIVLPSRPGPILLFGHSMGSIVALSAALRGTPKLAGLLIFSCPIQLAQRSGRIGRVLADRVCRWVPELRLPNLIGAEALSNDPQAIQAFRADPLVYGKVSIGWLHQFGLACEAIRRDAAAIVTPALFAHG